MPIPGVSPVIKTDSSHLRRSNSSCVRRSLMYTPRNKEIFTQISFILLQF